MLINLFHEFEREIHDALGLLLVDESQGALSAVSAVLMSSHEDSSAAGLSWAFASQTVNLSVLIDLVVFQDGELDLLSLVLDLLGGGVILLLAFLGTTAKAQHQMQGRLLLDVVVAQCTTIFQLLAGEDQALLIWGNAFFILNLSFDIFDSIRWLNLEGNGFTRQCFDEDLHGGGSVRTREE
jgi:hypothetical protein